MKILIGVNDVKHGIQKAEFAARLNFAHAEYHFVHAVLPIIQIPNEMRSDYELISEMLPNRIANFRMELSKAADDFGKRNGCSTFVHVCADSPTQAILKYADEAKVDVIVVGRSDRPAISQIALGAVSRSIVVSARTSVLVVASHALNPEEPLNVVVGTDFSEYCRNCFELLISLEPRGFKSLTVLNVFKDEELARMRWALPDVLDNFETVLSESLKKKISLDAEILKPLAPSLNTISVIGDLRDTIRETMKNTHSNLLILGAQGHNWYDRSVLGSTSFDQAIHESHSVLILRLTQSKL